MTGLCLAALVAATSVGAAAVPAPPDPTAPGVSGWRRAYVRDFEAGIRRAQLSEIDRRYLLRALTGTFPPSPPPMTDLQRLAAMPSLQRISATIIELCALSEYLERRYDLRLPRRTGADYIRVEDPEAPTPVDPVMDSWLLLRSASMNPRIPVATTPSWRRQTRPRRWRQPIRIAATGNAEFDSHVAAVLAELRRSHRRLPLDAQSFPNPTEQANLFLNDRGIVCPEQEACRSFDTRALVRAAAGTEDRWVWLRDVLGVLAAFDQLRDRRWVSRAEIVPLNAFIGLHVTSAWLRTRRDGTIDTAMCRWVTEPGSEVRVSDDSSAPEALRPATQDEIRGSIRACLGAAMGAPSTRPTWSVNIVPEYRDACCPDQPGLRPYSQDEMLREIYR